MKLNQIRIEPEVIVSAQKGNIADFEKIVSAYLGPVYNFIYRMVRSQADASDLAQESFIKLYLNIKRYDTKRKFSTWLFTIVQRTVYDWLRHKKRNREILIIDNPERNFNPADKQDNVGERMDIDKALSGMKSIYKMVLLLYYFEGYNYREIAEILEKPINTIKTLLRRAKKDFRYQLGIY